MARTFKGMSSVRKNAEEAASLLSSERILDIPNEKIKDSPLNEGLPMKDLEELARSLEATKGPITPAIVYDLGDGTYELVSGHRRREAWCRLLGNKTLQCRVREYPSDPYVRFREHATANTETREKDPLFWLPEIRHARELLKQTGFEGSEMEEKQKIYELLGKGASPQQIARYDGFSKLIPEMQDLCTYGISIPTLYNAVRLTEKEQKKLASRIKKYYKNPGHEEISRNDFIRMVNELKAARTGDAKAGKAAPKTYSAKTAHLELSLLKGLRSAKTAEDKQTAMSVIADLREQLNEIEKNLM
ncbi:MAG: ParB/RepB/Spo0J family partition protein [Lachnospiraceae bacterium]|nr:ParB/RepB/Spo0J family partition protein [Lachnospiraceae bacterium]